ncbi:MAG TPA: hypothetical protein VMU73_04300 [Gaiellaceae bacterium]|nr:hypothetical protein [Gaiellaceae bacterium]
MTEEQQKRIRETIANVLSRQRPIGPGLNNKVSRELLDRAVRDMAERRESPQEKTS